MTNHYSCFMGDDIINTLSSYCDESCCGCIVLNSACVVLTRLLSPPRAPTAVTPRLEVGRVTRRGFCTVQCNRLRETAGQNQSLKQLWNVQHYIIPTKWQTSMKDQKTTCLVDTKEQEVLLRISNFFPILISKESEASKSSANCHLFLEFLEICTLLLLWVTLVDHT